MNIKIVCVGKLKERFFRDGCDEYLKRLSKYASCEVVEVNDEKTPDGCSENMKTQIKLTEGRKILDKISEQEFVLALAIDGKMFTSEELADNIEKLMKNGKSKLCFVIGGSLGLSDEVLKRADMKISFSKQTFPHQLFRVMLLEQIYRCFRIINNEPYHK